MAQRRRRREQLPLPLRLTNRRSVRSVIFPRYGNRLWITDYRYHNRLQSGLIIIPITQHLEGWVAWPWDGARSVAMPETD